MATPAVAWFEVTGKDGAALQDFYGKLFDWHVQDAGDDSGYGLVAAAEKGIGGGIGPAPDGGEGQVTFYVEVDDVAGFLQKAEQLGGQTVVPRTEIAQFGLTFAFFADPEGHVVGLSEGAVPVSATPSENVVPRADDPALALDLPAITDEFMKQRLAQTESYALVMLKRTPKLKRPGVDPVIWEHGRRNMALHQEGLMPIVCPVRDESEWAGVCILTVPLDRANDIMSEDPAVKAGIFRYEVHPVAGFPGSGLPR